MRASHEMSAQPVTVRPRRRIARLGAWLMPAALLAWVLLNWGWTAGFGFTNDDFVWMAGADLRDRPDWLWQAVFPRYWSLVFFRPLVQLSFVINFLTSATNPFGYHLVNVALHAINAFAVWRLTLLLLGSQPTALMTACVFAVHPTISDAVAWISGRTELLCALFFLPAVIAHLHGRLARAVGLFALALCAKESAVSLPLVVLAADWCGLGKRPRPGRDVAVYSALIIGYLTVRAGLVGIFAADMLGLSPLRPWNVPEAWALTRTKVTLLGQFLLEPLPLHGLIRSAIVLSIGGAAALWYARRVDGQRARVIRFAIAWVGCTLLPYIGWARFYGLYVYLAVVGMSLLLVTLAADLAEVLRRRGYRALVPVGAAVWLAALVWHLQVTNEYQRRAGVLSLQVVRGIAAAVPAPPPHSLFVITGLEALRFGVNTWVNHLGVLDFGLPEALQLWLGDRSIDVDYGATPLTNDTGGRPIIYVHWDEGTATATRLPPPEKR